MIKKENKSEIFIVITTLDDESIAKEISTKLLSLRLAACINCRQVSSSYWWEGKINSTTEFELTMKTNIVNLETLLEKVLEIHPYDVPEVLYWAVRSSDEYYSWTEEICRK